MRGPGSFEEAVDRSRAAYQWGREERLNLSPRVKGDAAAWNALTDSQKCSYRLGYSETDRMAAGVKKLPIALVTGRL